MRRPALCLFLVVSSVANPAPAGELAPGGRGSDFEDYRMHPMPPEEQWQGPLLDEHAEAYVFESTHEGERVFQGATLTSSVYRDAGTGGLAFLYQLREGPSGGTVFDLEDLRITGFARSSTDLYTSSSDFSVRRSADGNELTFTFDQSTLDDDFLVRTDAAAYALNPGGFRVGIEFEPDRGTDSNRFAAFAPVPEPSAAAVGAGAAILLLRRRRGPRRAARTLTS